MSRAPYSPENPDFNLTPDLTHEGHVGDESQIDRLKNEAEPQAPDLAPPLAPAEKVIPPDLLEKHGEGNVTEEWDSATAGDNKKFDAQRGEIFDSNGESITARLRALQEGTATDLRPGEEKFTADQWAKHQEMIAGWQSDSTRVFEISYTPPGEEGKSECVTRTWLADNGQIQSKTFKIKLPEIKPEPAPSDTKTENEQTIGSNVGGVVTGLESGMSVGSTGAEAAKNIEQTVELTPAPAPVETVQTSSSVQEVKLVAIATEVSSVEVVPAAASSTNSIEQAVSKVNVESVATPIGKPEEARVVTEVKNEAVPAVAAVPEVQKNESPQYAETVVDTASPDVKISAEKVVEERVFSRETESVDEFKLTEVVVGVVEKEGAEKDEVQEEPESVAVEVKSVIIEKTEPAELTYEEVVAAETGISLETRDELAEIKSTPAELKSIEISETPKNPVVETLVTSAVEPAHVQKIEVQVAAPVLEKPVVAESNFGIELVEVEAEVDIKEEPEGVAIELVSESRVENVSVIEQPVLVPKTEYQVEEATEPVVAEATEIKEGVVSEVQVEHAEHVEHAEISHIEIPEVKTRVASVPTGELTEAVIEIPVLEVKKVITKPVETVQILPLETTTVVEVEMTGIELVENEAQAISSEVAVALVVEDKAQTIDVKPIVREKVVNETVELVTAPEIKVVTVMPEKISTTEATVAIVKEDSVQEFAPQERTSETISSVAAEIEPVSVTEKTVKSVSVENVVIKRAPAERVNKIKKNESAIEPEIKIVESLVEKPVVVVEKKSVTRSNAVELAVKPRSHSVVAVEEDEEKDKPLVRGAEEVFEVVFA